MSELYLFTTMQGVKYAFTPTVFSKTLNGDTYTPTACSRSAIQLHENLIKSEVNFTFPVTNAFAKSCIDVFIEGIILVQIYKDSKPFWTGRVIKAQLSGKTITITCDSGYTTVFRKSGGATLSTFCWKTLYSAQCGVNAGANTFSYTTYTLNGQFILVDNAATEGFFAGGLALIGDQIRGIIASNETSIQLTDGFNLPVSGNLQLQKGCSLTRTSCIGFGNLDNFGGFPYVPVLNPFLETGLL
jgi:hypothetical protein